MGKLYAVGIGPGNKENMTFRAYDVILKSDVIVGYNTYIDVLSGIYGEEELRGKEVISTGMGSEVQRCRLALEKASEGKCVSVICSGDAVIYGMAALIYELALEYSDVEIETVAGVTAAISGSAVAGAALGNDFSVISLSNYLTQKEVTYNRLKAAAESDMVIVFYNPNSKARPDCLKEACEYLQTLVGGERVCAVAKNIGREGQQCEVMTLNELKSVQVDMFSTVFIGCSKSMNINGKMITVRGYEK